MFCYVVSLNGLGILNVSPWSGLEKIRYNTYIIL